MIKSFVLSCFTLFSSSVISQQWTNCSWESFSNVVNNINVQLDSLKSIGMTMQTNIKMYESHVAERPIDSMVFNYFFRGDFAELWGEDEMQMSDKTAAIIVDYEDSIVNVTSPVDINKYNINTILQDMNVENAPELKCRQMDSIQVFFIPGGNGSGYEGFEYWVCNGKIYKYVAYSNTEVALKVVGSKKMVRPRMEIELRYSAEPNQESIGKGSLAKVIIAWDPIVPAEKYKNFEILDLR